MGWSSSFVCAVVRAASTAAATAQRVAADAVHGVSAGAAVGSRKGDVGGGGGRTSSVADVAVAEECCASAIATGAGAE